MQITMKGKNQGEWSEFYVLLYLLATGKLYEADEKFNVISDSFFPILKIIHTELQPYQVEFVLDGGEVIVLLHGEEVNRIKQDVLAKEANMLFKRIIAGKGAFIIPRAKIIMDALRIRNIKAGSKQKADISLLIHDIRTGIHALCGFSIKSYIGSAPTLLNASKATNFIFAVQGLTKLQGENINMINDKRKLQHRITQIYHLGGKLIYNRMASKIFQNNLYFIDSAFDRILAIMLSLSYTTGELDCLRLISDVAKYNPLHVSQANHFYSYKLKNSFVR